MPLISVIIAVYNDWIALESCLRSLAEQASAPPFEVIVVDDGSDQAAPDTVTRFSNQLVLTIAKQPHEGIASARNHGIRLSQGSLLLFVDADCETFNNTLHNLATEIERSPSENWFQLRLIGGGPGVSGRAENLRLAILQGHLVRADGRIRYLNTAGFAARKSSVDGEKGLFDPTVARGEDTFLLASLMRDGILPRYASTATVQHTVSLSLAAGIRKDLRSARLEARTFALIAASGISVRLSHRERLQILRSAWRLSAQPSIGRLAWVTLMFRQLLQRSVTLAYSILRPRSARREAASATEQVFRS